MNLFFEPTRGSPFCIEVGYFDSMLEIKEKIAKYRGIPVSDQTLVFNNQTLPDDLNIHYSDVFDRSHLRLILAGDTPRKIKLILKNPTSSARVTMEFDDNDCVLRIKEKIHEKEGIPVSRIMVSTNGMELQDDKCLHDCQLFDNSEAEVTLRPTSMTTNSGLQMGSTYLKNKKMKVIVMSKCGKKITVEVNDFDLVKELRKELEKVISQGVPFNLPEEGYFFIHKQNVMEEEESFRQNRVTAGDTIEIFNGRVTGGL